MTKKSLNMPDVSTVINQRHIVGKTVPKLMRTHVAKAGACPDTTHNPVRSRCLPGTTAHCIAAGQSTCESSACCASSKKNNSLFLTFACHYEASVFPCDFLNLDPWQFAASATCSEEKFDQCALERRFCCVNKRLHLRRV